MAAQETTTPQPKERIIFDADSYYGTEGEKQHRPGPRDRTLKKEDRHER